MKKVYAKLAGRKLNFFSPVYKASFVKMLSLSSIVALLSSASPVYSKTVSPKEAFLISAKSSSIVFPQSVISVYDDYNVDASDQENYVTALQGGSTLVESAVSDYVNFLINTLSKNSNDNVIVNILAAYSNSLPKSKFSAEEQYQKFITSPQLSNFSSSIPQQLAQDGGDVGIINRFVRSRDDVATRDSSDGNIRLGNPGKIYSIKHSIMIGNNIDYYYNNNVNGFRINSVIIGNNAGGGGTLYSNNRLVAIGYKAYAYRDDNVALGAHSHMGMEKDIAGYDPLTNASSKQQDDIWRNTLGGVGIGSSDNKTRRITGVAAGDKDTDAVNVAQLKAVREIAKTGWKLSVGEKTTNVDADNSLSFSSGSDNFKIVSDKNKITFDLARAITADSIKVGENTLDATGLVIKSGPKMTTAGIGAGNQKITGVAKGTEGTDAVNFAQLKEIKEQVASSGLVAQDTQTKDITIGKGTDGNKISIANKDGKGRVISGIANGAISDASTEAITGQQLHQFGTSIAGYFGGGAKYENGQWSTPKFKVKTVKDDGTESEQSYENVASAFEGVSKSITKIQNNITKEINNVVTKVEGDSLSWSKEDGAFVAKHGAEDAKTNSKIRFLANGDVSKDSTDAINGSQLYSLGDTFATYLGGGAKYENGEWTAPKFKVKTVKDDGSDVEDKEYKTVAEALAGVGTSITNVKKEINNEITNVKGDSLVKWDEATKLIKIGEEKEGSKINIKNKDGGARTISGVAAGSAETDAVNFSQLQKVEKDVKEQVAASSFVKQDLETKHLTIGKETDGDKIDIANNKNEKRTLAGIKGGALSADSNEAITGSQINKIGEDVAGFFGGGAAFSGGAFTKPSYEIHSIRTNGEVG
ncbi:hypothetical protein ME9_00436, partial [Bartonella taylorii 8TBB]